MTKRARVVRFIDDLRFTLALNIGEVDGVKTDDKYMVYGIDEGPIIDPETGEDLGALEIVKGRGKVILVQEKMCIIKSIAVKKIRKSPSEIMGVPHYFDSDRTEPVPFDNPQIGDYAKKI